MLNRRRIVPRPDGRWHIGLPRRCQAVSILIIMALLVVLASVLFRWLSPVPIMLQFIALWVLMHSSGVVVVGVLVVTPSVVVLAERVPLPILVTSRVIIIVVVATSVVQIARALLAVIVPGVSAAPASASAGLSRIRRYFLCSILSSGDINLIFFFRFICHFFR